MRYYFHAEPALDLYNELHIPKEPLPDSSISLSSRDTFLSFDLEAILETITTYPEQTQQSISTNIDLEAAPGTTLAPESIKPAKVIHIFISYAEFDEKLLEELQEHLTAMKYQYLAQENYKITIWHSGQIIPGQDWKQNIEQQLAQAHIILLVVSIKFLISELCRTIQIQQALDRHKNQQACVIPVILRACDWKHEAFGHLHPLPSHGKPVIKWKPRDDAYVDIIAGIRRAISNLP